MKKQNPHCVKPIVRTPLSKVLESPENFFQEVFWRSVRQSLTTLRRNMKKQYLYPQNMRLKPKLWLWSVRDLIVLGLCAPGAALVAVKFGWYFPAAMVALGAFLSVRPEEQSVLDFLSCAVRYFWSGQQHYEWREKK